MNLLEEHTARIIAETKLQELQGRYNTMEKGYDKCFEYFNDKYPDEMGEFLEEVKGD